jgi:hypothetical protein
MAHDAPPATRPPVPAGIQRLLDLAARDDAFRDELCARRAAAAPGAGVTLTRSERAVLDAVPAAQLGRMIAGLAAPQPDRREFLQQAAATGDGKPATVRASWIFRTER